MRHLISLVLALYFPSAFAAAKVSGHLSLMTSSYCEGSPLGSEADHLPKAQSIKNMKARFKWVQDRGYVKVLSSQSQEIAKNKAALLDFSAKLSAPAEKLAASVQITGKKFPKKAHIELMMKDKDNTEKKQDVEITLRGRKEGIMICGLLGGNYSLFFDF